VQARILGEFVGHGRVFSYISPRRWCREYSLRRIRALVCDVLGWLNRSFSCNRTNDAPRSLRSIAVQAFHCIRPERQMMCNWTTIACSAAAAAVPVWDPTSFTKNRERLKPGLHRRASASRTAAITTTSRTYTAMRPGATRMRVLVAVPASATCLLEFTPKSHLADAYGNNQWAYKQ
jgi:hypothetical protein